MNRVADRPGLYRQLALRLLLPMLVIVVTVGAIGVYSTERQTGEVFDRWLLDAAVSLSRQVRADGGRIVVDLPDAAQRMLAYDEIDQTFFSVENRGLNLIGTGGIPRHGTHEVDYAAGKAYDARIDGRDVRVAFVQPACAGCEGVSVVVAETMLKRQRAQRSAAWLLLPIGVLLLVTMGAIFIAVRSTIEPLKVLAEHWNRESHASLRPIPDGDLPRELSPFAIALNDLLARIRAMLLRERQFAATAAHQLRTPLTSLRLGLDRARNAPDFDSAMAVLSELDQSTHRTARLIQQLLLLGRIDPGSEVGVDLQPSDLRDIAVDVCGVLAEVALAKNIDLELAMPDVAVPVRMQRELLTEALGNLLDNALQATPARGRVAVVVAADPPRVGVSDSGPGIPPDERESVFERFGRGSSVSWAGSGLGLSIVRDIAMLHGARLTLDDAAEGGVCFEMTFSPPGRAVA